MQVVITTDPECIVALCENALDADPVGNTVLSSIATYVRRSPDGGEWCAHPEGDESVLAVRGSGRTPVALTEGWTDVAGLASALRGIDDLAGLGGPHEPVEALVAALSHQGPVHRMAERLFRCDTLEPPSSVAGNVRRASEDDLDLLAGWHAAFVAEAFGHAPDDFDPRADVARGLALSRPWIWSDGPPRAYAIGRAPVFGVARIGPVYTPPAYRGHGYGSAVTASARDILDAGGVPVLYTDLANPTSNKIYQAIGFRPVSDRLGVTFE